MTARQLLANKSFAHLWIAQTISLTGDYLAMFAVQIAIVFRLHGSAKDMTAVLFASIVPATLIGPLAGLFADRHHPRRTMIASDVARAGLILLLAFTSSVPAICAVCFAMSCASAFFAPAQSVTIPALVTKEELLTANLLMQQSSQIVRIASPAIAGALVAALGESACYAADSASFLLSAGLLATLRYSPPQRSTESTARGTSESWGTGSGSCLPNHGSLS